MVLKKFATVFLIEILILPIVLEVGSDQIYDSYREYKIINSVKFPKILSSYYNRNNIKKEINIKDNKPTNFDNSFVFPNDGLQARNDVYSIDTVANCDHKMQTFCEDVPNYPEDFVNQALTKNASLLHYAYEDVLEIAPRTDTNEDRLCVSLERIIRPKAGQNSKDEWRYILQSKQSNFYQGVRVETCMEDNIKCRLIDGFAEGYITTCKQKYIYRELSAISDDGNIIRDYFRFPASCCCHVELNTVDRYVRM